MAEVECGGGCAGGALQAILKVHNFFGNLHIHILLVH